MDNSEEIGNPNMPNIDQWQIEVLLRHEWEPSWYRRSMAPPNVVYFPSHPLEDCLHILSAHAEASGPIQALHWLIQIDPECIRIRNIHTNEIIPYVLL